MGKQEEQSQKEIKIAEKRVTLEAARVAKEKMIQKDQMEKEAKRLKKSQAEEPERLAREQTRRKTDLDREQAISADLEARKLKYEKQRRK